MEREAWLAFYRARGVVSIPLRPREKRPLHSGWQKADPAAWVSAPADANLGILCGSASGGLVVLDFDTRDGLREASGMRPEEMAVHTLVARTARGWHVYAREPNARTRSPWKGLDVRGEGSMVVAPPSIHATGVRYEFVKADATIAPLSTLPFTFETEAIEEDVSVEVDWNALEDLVAGQAAKLRAHWAFLKEPRGELDRSKADFAIARCLWEAGYPPSSIASVLLALPGSKARERGAAYATRTAQKAASASDWRRGERLARES